MTRIVHKHSLFVIRQESPFNGGPPLELLCESFVTPEPLFYVRSHGAVPIIDAEAYRLHIDGHVGKPLSLSLDELRSRFPRHEIGATLQCAGNRRSEMLPDADPSEQVMWGSEAVSNGVWAGARLSDVLRSAGIEESAQHAAFVGLDEIHKDGQTFGFGGSLPIEKALSAETLLAYEMNGQPLTPVHGFPLRVIAPGYIAARSVKWLARITLQPEPSTNFFQTRDYKVFPPQISAENVDWNEGQTLAEVGLNAVICAPDNGARLPSGGITVKGYAVASGGHTLTTVEISTDDGQSWRRAELTGEAQPWTWRLWRAELRLPPGDHTLVVRAADTSGKAQPSDLSAVWNFRGYMNNAWHRVRVRVD